MGGPGPALTIIYRGPDALRPYPRNAKRHPPEQLRMLQKSIESVGFAAPIVTDEHGMILAGHARWEVARRMGLEQVPTVPLPGLTQEQKQAYVLADNKLASLGKLDTDVLAMELGELQEIGFDLEAMGFSTADVDDLLGDGALPDLEPEEPEPDIDGTVTCPECGFRFPAKVESVRKKPNNGGRNAKRR